jgi:hypothetical protein
MGWIYEVKIEDWRLQSEDKVTLPRIVILSGALRALFSPFFSG